MNFDIVMDNDRCGIEKNQRKTLYSISVPLIRTIIRLHG